MDGTMIFWISLIAVLAIWDAVWKALGMWHSARNKHLGWFICFLIFNTAGILPIVYLKFFQKTKKKK